MKLPRRQFLHLAAGAAALPALPRIARAQTYPSRPVRVIVPYAPGGPTDIFARLIAQKLSERFGKQFYVENIGGAGGNVGMGQGQRHQDDGGACSGCECKQDQRANGLLPFHAPGRNADPHTMMDRPRRLERLPGGTCTHWKAPPCRGAHPTRTLGMISICCQG